MTDLCLNCALPLPDPPFIVDSALGVAIYNKLHPDAPRVDLRFCSERCNRCMRYHNAVAMGAVGRLRDALLPSVDNLINYDNVAFGDLLEPQDLETQARRWERIRRLLDAIASKTGLLP